MSNSETIDCTYSGLQVDFVELRPFAGKNDCNETSEVRKHIVKNVTTSKFTLNYMDSPVFDGVSPEDELPSTIPIKRLAWSKDSTFLAVMATWKESAFITVWDMRYIGDLSKSQADTTILHRHCAATIIKHHPQPNRDFTNLSIGLAISPKGDQVALYQEPKIGHWGDGSKLEDSEFRFSLFDNPLIKQQVSLSVAHDSFSPSGGKPSTTSGLGVAPRLYGNAPPLERHTSIPHRTLRNFIGYGAFLTETENNYWEMSDVKTALNANIGVEDRQYEEGFKPNDQNRQPATSSTMFVACNGIYIDIFKIKSAQKWDHCHSVNLADLVPTLSRRITCKVLMEVVTSNTFMWLEDGGLCCTIWDLQKGFNVSYIASTDDTKQASSVFKGNSKVAISPDESIVTMAGADGSLTTYSTGTGIVVSGRRFPKHHLEYIAFHGQNSQLFVILRDSESFELSSLIVDPLQLDSGEQANPVPIPIIGKTILAFFRDALFKDQGLVCEADGNKINFYTTREPVKNLVAKVQNNLVDPAGRFYPPQILGPELEIQDDIKEEPQDEAMAPPQVDKSYELRTDYDRELFRDGDGSIYWVHRVEVVDITLQEKPVFSFIPEPWMRVSATEVRQPQQLVKAYFLPGGERFVVHGMQSLQVWSLPTEENPDFSLVFIWSQPRTWYDPIITSRNKKYRTEPVGQYYHRIVGLDIYLDRDTDHAVADIKLRNGTDQRGIIIPGAHSSNTRMEYLHCIRSIHLLAYAYAYSTKTKNLTKKSPPVKFTFEKHAQAIARFTRSHMNRLISDKDFYPQQVSHEQRDQEQRTRMSLPTNPKGTIGDSNAFKVLSTYKAASQAANSKLNRTGAKSFVMNLFRRAPKQFDPAQRPEVVTILTLLLDQVDLADANRVFVEALFLTCIGNEWIPHASNALNPVKRAIEFRNERLLKILIDYSMRCSKTIHLGYLEPVEQCLSDLLDRYPEIVADIFMKTSYIPVHNEAYVISHAIDSSSTSITFSNVFNGAQPNAGENEESDNKVLTLRSQLPTSNKLRRDTKIPVRSHKKLLRDNRSSKIYVSPFQFQSVVRSIQNPYDVPHDEGQKDSVFARIAGGDYFDSPAMVVSLLYKWNKFGRRYWWMRFCFVLVFFVLVLVITSQQIVVSTAWQGEAPTHDELEARYMLEWKPVFMVTAAMGLLLVLYETLQFTYSPLEYIKSPYNYVDLAAYLSPVIGCFIFLNENPIKEYPEEGIVDNGPSSIWIMGYGILFLYLNFLFELRVFRPLGIVVNIIFNITRRIGWFFLVFGLFLVSFTHSLLYVLHTRRYRTCAQDNSCGDDYPSTYPTGFWRALSATYFFLAGRYDPVDSSLEKGSIGFQIMMVIFFFFTAILLLNILIALMNDAFNASEQEGELAHLKLLSEVIAGKHSIVSKILTVFPIYD
ncbi:hypothetical protein B0O80DRAFT_111232 [Mortierella sp. GBAus27b]|nr:hypothetical protein B0O80DRAFT_111232 [Mortierella sp. GBAus27b]